MIRSGYDKNPAAPRRTTVEPYGGCGGGTNASVDEPLDNLWTAGANRVRRAVHSLWTALGTTDAGESEQRKRFPHLVWTRKSHRRVASGLGTLDTRPVGGPRAGTAASSTPTSATGSGRPA